MWAVWRDNKMALTYWTYMGTIYLIILLWQDYKNKMKIDDRLNYFMMGMTISLISHISTGLWYRLALVAVVIGLHIFLSRLKVIGAGDVNSFTWIFTGYGLIDPIYLAVFCVVLATLTITYMALKKILKYEQPVQFYPVILISFLISSFFLGMY